MGPAAYEDPDDVLVCLVELLVLSPGRDEGEVARGQLVPLQLLYVVVRVRHQHALARRRVDDGVWYRETGRYMVSVEVHSPDFVVFVVLPIYGYHLGWQTHLVRRGDARLTHSWPWR